MLELVDRLRCFAHEIFDRVLVAQPVGALDGIVHVPRPVVGVLPRLAAIPPCAATVCERVGKTLVMLAVLRPLSAAPIVAQARTARADDHVMGVVGDRIFATVDAESVVPGHQALLQGEAGDRNEAEGAAADGCKVEKGERAELGPGIVDIVLDQHLQAEAGMPGADTISASAVAGSVCDAQPVTVAKE